MPTKYTMKRNNSGFGEYYKPLLHANLAGNNTDFYIPVGIFTDSHLQSACSAYLCDVFGPGVWKTSITAVPGQLRVYKAK